MKVQIDAAVLESLVREARYAHRCALASGVPSTAVVRDLGHAIRRVQTVLIGARRAGAEAKTGEAADVDKLRAENDRLRGAIYRVSTAIQNAGAFPAYHFELYAKHRREWPTLWRAIDDLFRAARD